jgi:hypothetical protein
VTISSRVRATRPPASLTAPHHKPPASSRRSRLITSVPLRNTFHLELGPDESDVNNSTVPPSRPCPSLCQKTSGAGDPWTGQSKKTLCSKNPRTSRGKNACPLLLIPALLFHVGCSIVHRWNKYEKHFKQLKIKWKKKQLKTFQMYYNNYK